MDNFAAIDFETANNHRESVCSVGVVIVRNNKVSDTFYELIRPAPNYYCDWATDIHGLTYEDTIDADPYRDESNHEFPWPSRNKNSGLGVSTHKTCPILSDFLLSQYQHCTRFCDVCWLFQNLLPQNHSCYSFITGSFQKACLS